MPKDNNKTQTIPKAIQNMIKGIQGSMDKLYANTYFNTPTNNKALNILKKDIDSSIKGIFDGNVEKVGIPNISSLYKRMDAMQSDPQVMKGIEDIFADKSAMNMISSAYQQNLWIKDMREEIDAICKYMPKLEEALETRKDNVLSADYFNKDFIFVSSKDTKGDESVIFNKRITELKEKYNLLERCEQYYDEISKYGEQFVYVVPYEKAINKLLQNKAGRTFSAALSTRENCIIEESGSVFSLDESASFDNKIGTEQIHIELCTSNILEDAVLDMKNANDRMSAINEMSVWSFNETAKGRFDKPIIGDELEFDKFDDGIAMDGLINPLEQEKNKVSTPGCVIREIDAMKVIPIYIDNLCLGYYYIECTEFDKSNTLYKTRPTLQANNASRNGVQGLNDSTENDMLLKYISANLSKYIDAKFVNANQDLRDEIYMILKCNDTMNNPENAKIKVTFIPPDDMIHFHFNMDKDTHHGISDLVDAFFPAKLYISLLIGNVLALLTRAQDKRVYYVKQNVETNIAKTLINVMNQVKKGNMGIRQIENVNTILNMTGKFNDYIIPTGPNGDPAISFEVMQGQNVDIKTDLMNMLEEMAVNTTSVPLELISARQSIDYAVQYTMQNSKFLRKVFNRQGKYQRKLSLFLSKIYSCEYNENISLEVNLPSPLFINMTNTNQIIANNREYVQAIADIELADEQDEVVKAIFIKNMTRHTLSTYLDLSTIETIKSKARQERQTLITGQESADLTIAKEQALLEYYDKFKASCM